MPSGGARLNSGPPPDPDALRRDRPADKDGWVTLPAEGYAGPVPGWPLTGQIVGLRIGPQIAAEVMTQERKLWAYLWTTPQAAWWAANSMEYTVAQYCRYAAIAETGHSLSAAEARQREDRLGLNPASMLRNRWRVAPTKVEDNDKQASNSGQASSKNRLSVVKNAG